MVRYGLIASAAAAMLVSAPGLASAATYDFSYSYDPGQVITGSFNGTDEGGGLVGDIKNISAQVNGVSFNGPLAAWTHTSISCSSCYSQTGAVASADFFANNFFLTDGDATGSDPSKPQTNWFYIIPWPDSSGIGTQYFQAPGTYFNYDNNPVNPAGWSLVQVAGSVPEPAGWAMMLIGVGLAGAMLRRRAGAGSRA